MLKLVVFVALVAVASSEFVFPTFITDSIVSCMIDHGVITQEDQASRTRPLSEEDECFVKCFLQTFKAIDKDGNFTPREYLLNSHVVSESEIESKVNLLKDCGFPETVNICERAEKISRCLHAEK